MPCFIYSEIDQLIFTRPSRPIYSRIFYTRPLTDETRKRYDLILEKDISFEMTIAQMPFDESFIKDVLKPLQIGRMDRLIEIISWCVCA